MASLFAACIAYFWALLSTPFVRSIAVRFGVVDRPGEYRKIHRRPTPLLGGIAIVVAIAAGVIFALAAHVMPGPHIKMKFLIGIALAAAILTIGGALDDRYNLTPARQIIWPVLAAVVIIASGIGIPTVTNPFGGLFRLDQTVFTVLWWQGIPYKLTLFADLFTFAWLMGMTYTTKLLDGLDGLVSGIVVIGGIVVAAVSITRDVAQYDTAALALVIAAAFFGFLRFNRHPATIFLGEGGSTLAGFLLGVLAIISGGKIATTLLVLGLPLFDAALVVVRRISRGESPFKANRDHLHHRLLDSGFTQRQAVLLYYLVAAALGSLTLILDGGKKKIAVALVFAAVLFASWYAARRRKPATGVPLM